MHHVLDLVRYAYAYAYSEFRILNMRIGSDLLAQLHLSRTQKTIYLDLPSINYSKNYAYSN